MDNEKQTISAGDLYTMNKQMIKQGGKLSNYKIDTVVRPRIEKFFRKDRDSESTKYFMLLCNEMKDYTIFHMNWNLQSDAEATEILLNECIKNRGILYLAEYDNVNENAIEIWIESFEDGELHCYYLFPYGLAVIEV